VRELNANIQLAERADTNVLISGERAADPGELARLVHSHSRRRSGPFATVRCAGLSDAQMEIELCRAAAEAHGGSLLIDDVDAIGRRAQEGLLQFLDDGVLPRQGDPPQVVDVRVFATTTEPLFDRVAAEAFREDLYYRLNVIHITVRPLRGAREVIPSLVTHLIRHISTHHQMTTPRIAPAAMESLKAYDWPGNIRELRAVLESVLVLRAGAVIEANDLPPVIAGTRS
jgi:two-component system response regulator AtoC